MQVQLSADIVYVKKKRVPKKGDVVGALGHTGTFQVLSVDLRNRSVDLRSLEKRNVPAEVLEGVPFLVASGFFIWSLQFVQTYNAAFYLKLSISVPLIYAIAFCNVQYSRERRLEEEY